MNNDQQKSKNKTINSQNLKTNKMKKILFALAAGLIPALAVTNETYAQNSGDLASAKPVIHFPWMKNTVNSEKPNMVTLNLKALKNFKKYYKANDEKWSKGIDCIAASYISDGVTHFIYYDKKGNWTGSLKIYNEDKMPKDIRKMVKREYYDYKILAVKEVETVAASEQPTYIVTIEDEKNVKQIRIHNDNMDVYQEFKRSY